MNYKYHPKTSVELRDILEKKFLEYKVLMMSPIGKQT